MEVIYEPGDRFVRLRLAKGVLLIFTVDEYRHAVKRGKAEQRSQRQAKREAQQHAEQEAVLLGWIE